MGDDEDACGDEPRFIETVEATFTGCIRALDLPCIWLVRIDNHFDDRWFAFAGKFRGAVGVQRIEPLHVPPFHPHRVVRERFFVRNEVTQEVTQEPAWLPARAPVRLHVWQNGHANLRASRRMNRIGGVARRAAFLWFSSASQKNGNGSAMTYVVDGEQTLAWYARFAAANDWQPTDIVGSDAEQLTRCARSGRGDINGNGINGINGDAGAR